MGLFTGHYAAFDEPFYWFQRMLLRMIPSFFRVTKLGGPAVVDINPDGTCPPGFRRESHQGRPYCLVLGVPGPSPQEDTEDEEKGEEDEETDEESSEEDVEETPSSDESREDTESSQDGDEGKADEESRETGERTPEQERAEESARRGYENSATREENRTILARLFGQAMYGTVAPGFGPSQNPYTPPPTPPPPWLQTLQRLLTIKNQWPPPLPGLTFIFGPKGITGRVLIPVPGLPTWIQGGGVEFPITADGKLVVDDEVKAKIKELLDKARAVPTDISRKLEELLAKTREAGEDIQDIYTDGDGNILADVIDSTGKVVRTITLPADVLLTDTKNEGLLEWILSSQIIAGAFGLLGKALGGKGPRIGEKEAEEETEEEGAEEEKGTGVGVVGVDDEEESTDGPFSDVEEDTTTDETGFEEEVPGEGEEEERDRHDPERREPPDGQEGDGPVPGDDISSTELRLTKND